MWKLVSGNFAQRLIYAIATAATIICVASIPAGAQQVMRIAAVVNNDIITVHDVEARMRIVFASTGLRATKSMVERVGRRVLRTLIDEKLQNQEAKKSNISVTKSDFSRAVSVLEKRNRLRPGGFREFARTKNIDWEAMEAQINAHIIWSKLIRRVLRPRVVIGEDEVDEKLEQLKRKRGTREFQVSEILLSVNDRQDAPAVKRNADRLIGDIKQGAAFEALARQFSDSSSASVGGDIGWLQEEFLPGVFQSVVPGMKAGDVAGPIQAVGGYYIVKLNKARRVLAGSPLDGEVEVQRILFVLPANAGQAETQSQIDLAKLIGETISGCADFDRAAKEAGFRGKTNMGTLPLKDLAPVVRKNVQDLPVGKSGPPIRIGNQVALFMVCKRKDPKSGLPERDDIRGQLLRERLDILSRRYMRDLRAGAVVDIRT